MVILQKLNTWNVAGDCVKELIRPRNCQKLLPPSRSHIGHVETEDERQWNKTQECIEVFDYAFKQPGNDFDQEYRKQLLFTFFGHCSWAFCRMRQGVCRRWEKGWALYRWACTGIPKSEPVPIRHFSCTHFCPLSLSKHLQISNPKGITNSYSYSRRQLKSIVLSESKRNLIQQHYCC